MFIPDSSRMYDRAALSCPSARSLTARTNWEQLEARLGSTRFPRRSRDRQPRVFRHARKGAPTDQATREASASRKALESRHYDRIEQPASRFGAWHRLPNHPGGSVQAIRATVAVHSGGPGRWCARTLDGTKGCNAARRGRPMPQELGAGPTCHGPDAGRGNPAATDAPFEVQTTRQFPREWVAGSGRRATCASRAGRS
jgi:hypothetical protein